MGWRLLGIGRLVCWLFRLTQSSTRQWARNRFGIYEHESPYRGLSLDAFSTSRRLGFMPGSVLLLPSLPLLHNNYSPNVNHQTPALSVGYS